MSRKKASQGFFNGGDGFIVVGDNKVFTKKYVEFLGGELEAVFGAKGHGIQDDVDVFAPVIHFGSVGFLQGVNHGQRVEAEDAGQDRLSRFVGLAVEVDPQQGFGFGEQGSVFFDGNIGARLLVGDKAEGTDYFVSELRISMNLLIIFNNIVNSF